MKHIIIIGTGIGGVPAAFEIYDELKGQVKITVVSKADHFSFTPSNPWVAIGWRQQEKIEVKLKDIFARKYIDFVVSEVEKIDPKNNQVFCANNQIVNYDYLVIATGPKLSFDEIEGLGPDKYTNSICTTEHAVKTYKNWQAFIKDPGHIVIGATQGASCFGPAYEFAFIVDHELRKHKMRHEFPITFVTSEPYLGHLGLGGVGDTKSMMESEFRNRDIKWITNAKIDKIDSQLVKISQLNDKGELYLEHEIASRFKMFIPPFTGIDALRNVDGLVNDRGMVIVDDFQRNKTYQNIFAIGVCVAIPPVEKTPVATGCPKTGFMIESMVTTVAKNLHQIIIDEKEPSNRATLNAVCLADFGDGGVAFVALPQIPPRNLNWSSSGRWVHYAKLAFEKYFLLKIKKGISETLYEKYVFKFLNIKRLKENNK